MWSSPSGKRSDSAHRGPLLKDSFSGIEILVPKTAEMSVMCLGFLERNKSSVFSRRFGGFGFECCLQVELNEALLVFGIKPFG